ncbi:MAG: class II aldolase/adducin family protein [Gammaproteobacteria bacterium]|nr:class II aldolase/adducin family protein [Gammaproteobacteria bacterium]
MVRAMATLEKAGLNEGAAGNLSVRLEDGFLVTPSGVKGPALGADMMVRMDADGAHVAGANPPSSEWRIHRAVYAAYADTHAVVHTHSPHATALACLHRSIPAFHYTVALAGADAIPCTPYATFGSEALAKVVVEGLAASRACLLANHGVVACAADLDGAVALAAHVEYLARVYLIAIAAGDPVLLDDAEMARVRAGIAAYAGRGG